VAFGAVDGRAVVVSGSSYKTIRQWDARTHFGEVVVSLGDAIRTTAHQSDAGLVVGMGRGLLCLDFQGEVES
jgi:hypothetical protein